MSKTALIWLAIYFGGVVLTLVRHPIYGLLTYLFEYFNHPASYWWGADLPDLRWSLFAALVTLVSLIIRWDQFKPIKAPPFKWFVAFVLWALVVTYTVAISVEASQSKLVILIKLAILYFLIVKIVQSEREYRMFVWAIILGCWLFSWRAYLDPRLEGGKLESVGGTDTIGSNGLPVLLLISLSFIGLYVFTGKRWERILSVIVAPFILNTFILCNSRGAFVGLLALVAAAALPGLRILKLKAILVLLLGGILLVQLMDQRFIDRMLDLKNPSVIAVEDGSAGGRITSWKGGWKLMRDYPLGAGGKGYRLLSPIYIPEIVEASGGVLRAPHNTYIKIGSHWGFPGLFLWLFFVGSTFWGLHRFRKSQYSSDRYAIEGLAIKAALIGFLVASLFIDRLYSEGLYWLCAMGASLWNVSGSIDPRTAKPDQSRHRVTEAIIGWRIKHQIRKAEKLSKKTGQIGILNRPRNE